MQSATKVFVETIHVVRHLGRFGLRHLDHAASHVMLAAEELTLWGLGSKPAKDILGDQRRKEIEDHISQAREVVPKYTTALMQQSVQSALQSSAHAATQIIHAAGGESRVIGPFDERWTMVKVIKDLRSVAGSVDSKQRGTQSRLTPRRFVHLMREAETTRARMLIRDPIEIYVDQMLSSSTITSIGPVAFERKLYTDFARIICFAFDQAMKEVSGLELWGHELMVHTSRSTTDDKAHMKRQTSRIVTQQVETMVDQMLRGEDSPANILVQGSQKQLLVNCCVMVLQLLEDLTSKRSMQVNLLGHALRVHLVPMPLEQLTAMPMPDGPRAQRLEGSRQAIDELVGALLDAEPDNHLVLMPHVVESEVYRYILGRMILFGQEILGRLHIRIFGIEVRLALDAEQVTPKSRGLELDTEIRVSPEELTRCMERLDEELRLIEHELQLRHQGDVAEGRALADTAEAVRGGAAGTAQGDNDIQQEEAEDRPHEFQELAKQDRLSRSLAIREVLKIPIEVAFDMVSDFDSYARWMPFCTSGRVYVTDDGQSHCEIGFGIDTGTMLGTVGDNIVYKVTTVPPHDTQPGEANNMRGFLRTARVVADTVDGFAYAKRLVYDWRFSELASGDCDIRLDIFFQANGVFSLPLWDSMVSTITGQMMKRFMQHAESMSRDRVFQPEATAPGVADANAAMIAVAGQGAAANEDVIIFHPPRETGVAGEPTAGVEVTPQMTTASSTPVGVSRASTRVHPSH